MIHNVRFFSSIIWHRAKYAVQAIKKKLFSPNPHTAQYALLVLESVVKNCGAPVHDEISNKANCEMFQQLVNNTPHEEVRAKMLELIQAWACAFRSVFKYRSIRVSSLLVDCGTEMGANWIKSRAKKRFRVRFAACCVGWSVALCCSVAAER